MKKLKRLALFSVFTLLFSIQAFALPEIDIQSKSSILVEPVSGEVLYAKNENEKVFPASTTKIMTTMLALEHGNLTDVVTVSATSGEGIDLSGSSVSPALVEGEQLTLENLLYCVMVASDNRACNVVAEYVAGSVSDFVDMMNERAAALGCTNTHFANPHGLHDENHYTTAHDLYLITHEAIKSSVFTTICNTESKKIPPTNLTKTERVFFTTNYLISKLKQPGYVYEPAKGVKTGHTTPAGACLVAMAEKNDMLLISVVMGAERETGGTVHSFTETTKLFEWGFQNFTKKTLMEQGEAVAETKVSLSQDKDYVVAQAETSVDGIVPKDYDASKVTRTIKLNDQDGVEAPIHKGQELGTVSISYEGRDYGSVKLVAANDIERSEFLYITKRVREFLSQPWLWFTIAGVVLLIIFYTVFMVRHNLKRRRERGSYRGTRRSRKR